MASYPTSLDAFSNPAPTDPLDTPSHSGQHSNVNDAVEELEEKLGIGASTPSAGKVLVGTGSGSSGWVTRASRCGGRFPSPSSGSPPVRLEMPFAGSFVGWTVLNDVAGSVTFDVRRDSYANYPPDSGDSITASDQPKTTSALKAQGSCTGWGTFSAGDIIHIVVTSSAGVGLSDVLLSVVAS